MIPQDPAILFSYLNTWLRDHEGGREAFLDSHELDEAGWEDLARRLKTIGYEWRDDEGRFV